MNRKKEFKKNLQYEKKRYNLTKANLFISIFNVSEKSIIWKYQKRLRKWEYHYNSKHHIRSKIFHILTNKLGFKYGIHISPNCFGFGLKIMHLGPIIVNKNTRIGSNCVLNINCSFVSTNGDDFAPQCGNNCKFGIGSTMIGKIKIGDNVAVGAGAVVTKSFGDNLTIAGVPAKIVSEKGIL